MDVSQLASRDQPMLFLCDVFEAILHLRVFIMLEMILLILLKHFAYQIYYESSLQANLS